MISNIIYVHVYSNVHTCVFVSVFVQVLFFYSLNVEICSEIVIDCPTRKESVYFVSSDLSFDEDEGTFETLRFPPTFFLKVEKL